MSERKRGAWVGAFIERLGVGRNVRLAAAEVGIDRTVAYHKRKRDAGFAARWDAALAQGAVEMGPWGPRVPEARPTAGMAEQAARAGEALVLRQSKREGVQLVRAVGGRWSAKRERDFLATLAESANVRKAAAATGLSTTAIYA